MVSSALIIAAEDSSINAFLSLEGFGWFLVERAMVMIDIWNTCVYHYSTFWYLSRFACIIGSDFPSGELNSFCIRNMVVRKRFCILLCGNYYGR